MCDEREQLVAYLYDEVDANERRNVEAHLASCETCREELRGFRDVRQDLLAWDVPHHDSVWKPFVTTRPQPVWRQMPAWSLAAAAMLMFAIGGAGGFAGRVLASRAIEPAPQVATIEAPIAPAPVQTAATDVASLSELRAMQARLSQLEHASSVRTVSSAPAVTTASLDTASLARVEQLIKESEGRVTRSTMQRILSMIQDLGNQQRADKALFQQQISDTQEQINRNILRVMNTRSPEKEQ